MSALKTALNNYIIYIGKKIYPPTSAEAFHSLDPIKINEIHKKILAGLEVLSSATFEDLADHLHLEPQRVWRRLSELGKANLIHRPGDRKVMKSGRQGMTWKLGPFPESVTKNKIVMKGPAVVDFSRAINQVQQSIPIQQTLF